MERIHNKNIVHLAKELRKDMTKEERHLWYDYLKPYYQTYRIKFTRQKVIGNYIVDFYCPQAKLVIELDGRQHYEENAEQYDNERTQYLNTHGIDVIRYSDRDIHTRFKEVCSDIDYQVTVRLQR